MKSLTEQFADWVRTKPADEQYDYRSPDRCAFAQFLSENGLAKEPGVGDRDWIDFASGRPFVLHPLPEGLDNVVERRPNTFGALADRLSASPNRNLCRWARR